MLDFGSGVKLGDVAGALATLPAARCAAAETTGHKVDPVAGYVHVFPDDLKRLGEDERGRPNVSGA